MESKKTIIFIEPMTDLTQAIWNAFETGNVPVNLYKAASSAQASEVLRKFYPAVTLIVDAKEALDYLGQNVKINRITSSKTLLITKNKLPPKIVEKMQNFGLTEALDETIQGKSLLYKVQFLIKSLPDHDKIRLKSEHDDKVEIKGKRPEPEAVDDKQEKKPLPELSEKELAALTPEELKKRREARLEQVQEPEPVIQIANRKDETELEDIDKAAIEEVKETTPPTPKMVSAAEIQKNRQALLDSAEEWEDDMKEIVDDFCNESDSLLKEMTELLESFEQNPLKEMAKLETFGQLIDRIMGSAKTLGLVDYATYCELGKIIGYKSSQSGNAVLLDIVGAVLMDTIKILETLTQELRTGKKIPPDPKRHKSFISRLKWLDNKFKNIERGSVAYDTKEAKEVLSQNSIDDLLSSLGF